MGERASRTARQKANRKGGCMEHVVVEERLVLNKANLAFGGDREGLSGGDWLLVYLRGWLRGVLGVFLG